MRKIALRIFGITLVVAALGSSLPQPAHAQVCNLLCIKGYQCCFDANGNPYCARHC